MSKAGARLVSKAGEQGWSKAGARMSPSVTPGREVELVASGGSQGCLPMAGDVS